MTGEWYWHVHHDVLAEPLTAPLQERLDYINKYKPEKERALRLRLIRPVRGSLPAAYDMARTSSDTAQKAVNMAWKDYDSAWQAWDNVCSSRVDYHIRANYLKAWGVYRTALAAYNTARESAIEALHIIECPDCPWNGQTIFP